jgi:hypothetical protein
MDGIHTTTSSLSYKGWRVLPTALIRLFPTRQGSFNLRLIPLALLMGIGLDYKYRTHLSFRVIQADYGYTRLPNLAGNDQNLLRISSGITIHLK